MHLHNHNQIRNQIRDIGGADYKALSAAIRGVVNLLAPKGDEADIKDQTLGIENLRGAYTQWVQSRREGIRATLWGEAMKIIAGGTTTWTQIEAEAQALRGNDKIAAFAKALVGDFSDEDDDGDEAYEDDGDDGGEAEADGEEGEE